MKKNNEKFATTIFLFRISLFFFSFLFSPSIILHNIRYKVYFFLKFSNFQTPEISRKVIFSSYFFYEKRNWRNQVTMIIRLTGII